MTGKCTITIPKTGQRCDKPGFCKGMCSMHYSRNQRYGDPHFTKKAGPLDPNATEKECPRCELTRPLADFRVRRGGTPAGWCKPCEKEYGRDYAQTEHGRARHIAARQTWNDKSHEYFLQYRYGIGAADYARMLAEQGGRCAICRTDEPGGQNGKWCVDHCHDSLKVRGLLCTHCNMAIGQMRDDPARLRAAADYLERAECPPEQA